MRKILQRGAVGNSITSLLRSLMDLMRLQTSI